MAGKLTKAQARVVAANPTAAKIVANAVEQPNGCWAWRGILTKYGTVAIDGRARRVHRESYRVFNGNIEEGLCVCHHCDNPGCVNPLHLFPATTRINNLDMIRKGRAKNQITSSQSHFKAGHAPRGEKGSGAKLTEAQAMEIVRRRRAGEKTSPLAAEYGVDRTTVQRLLRGQNWKGIAGRAALEAKED